MTDKKLFDGIILPSTLPLRSDEHKIKIEGVMEITVRELDHVPPELKFNLAFPRAGGLSRAGIFWLEGARRHGPYSTQECCDRLLPYFSELSRDKLAIRVRPTAVEDGTSLEYDFIFWANGKPVAPGHQYAFGVSRLKSALNGATVGDVINAWRDEKQDIRLSRGVVETREIYEDILSI